MYEELDTVKLTEALPAAHLPAGTQGAVVAVWGDHEAYEVEFTAGARTLALTTVRPEQLALVERYVPTAEHATTA